MKPRHARDGLGRDRQSHAPWRQAIRWTVALCVGVAASALGQSRPSSEPATINTTTKPTASSRSGDTRALAVSPRLTPVPVLKHPLRIEAIDQVEGNAAPLYLQAFTAIASDPAIRQAIDASDGRESDDAFSAWAAEHATWLDASVPPLIAMATRRRDCDWGVSPQFENIELILPYLSQARQAANYLRVKFRLAMIRGEVDRAADLLLATSTLADRVNDRPSMLITALVGVGIQSMCSNMLAEFQQHPAAPNLYWALRSLPVPFVDLHRTMQGEQGLALTQFPTLRKPQEGREILATDWQAFMGEIAQYVEGNQREPSPLQTGAAAGLLAMASHGTAQAYYARTRNLTPEQVAKLEPLKVVATYAIESYHRLNDDVAKWFLTPYPQMLPGLRTRWQAATLEAMNQPLPVAALFSTVGPSFHRFAQSSARLDRTIAALTVVEAIRAYAAANDGRLPATLDAIVDTPTPLNPVTGKSFDYSVNGDVATISDDGALLDGPLRYEVRLRR